jgi:hypothetical protein
MTRQERDDLILWHEGRMRELRYPIAVVIELRRARDRWLAGAK